MLPALILGFVLSTTGAHVALAGGNESPTKTAALDCQGAIGGGSATSAENVTRIGGVVALQTSASNERALQTSRDPDAHGSVQRYLAKSPLYVRTEGRSAVIKVPQKARGHVALTWGNTDHDGVATRTLTVGPCAGGVGWIVFPGGFYVDRPRCIELLVEVSGRTHRITVGVGAPCAGQGPPVQPSDA
jgi:hypothetical protein